MTNHKKQLKRSSKFLSLILRHKPETIGLELDENGWADVNELLIKWNEPAFYSPDFADPKYLQEIVTTNNKQRFEFNEDKTKIRARQGHSIDVDVELEEKVPDVYLYHGTSDRFLESIKREGLKPGSRQYVHLSNDQETAEKVGIRHGGKVIVLRVKAIDYQEETEAKFYLSRNGVWLTEKVPSKFLIFPFSDRS